MFTNTTILTKMQADKYLALALDHALAGVRDEMLKQAENVQAGATRLLFYTSCFTDNYQDVCSKLKTEDFRMMLNIYDLLGKRYVIERMVKIYVDLLLQNLTPERIRRIERALFKQGASLASGSLTNQALGGAITAAVCYSFGMNVAIDRVLLRYSTYAVAVAGWYGYVQKAADAADRLKQQNNIYYRALYAEKLEMMYFLIEPVISRNPALSRIVSSDEEITSAIMRIIR